MYSNTLTKLIHYTLVNILYYIIVTWSITKSQYFLRYTNSGTNIKRQKQNFYLQNGPHVCLTSRWISRSGRVLIQSRQTGGRSGPVGWRRRKYGGRRIGCGHVLLGVQTGKIRRRRGWDLCG